jgi:branched-chain amino acid transport system substrate-binding protein
MKRSFPSFKILFLAVFALLWALTITQGAPNIARAQDGPGATPTAMPLSGDPILIGVAVAQTSDTALLGQEQVLGAQVAEAFFNQRGGVNGRPIKLVYEDAAGAPETAINAFNALINGNVVAIIGPTLSTQARAADPVADAAGVPVLAPSNTAAGIPQLGAYVTRVSAGVASYAFNAITVAKEMNADLKNVAVAYAQDDVFSTSETKVFQQGVTDQGLNLATVQTFSVKDKDFTTQISAMQATEPDLIIISGLAVDGGNLVKQLRDLGYTGLIIGGNGLNTSNMFAVCQAQCDGVIVAQAYGPALDTTINNEFVQAFQLMHNKPQPPQFAGQLFACVQVVVESLRAMDSKSAIDGMDVAALRTALNDQIQAGTYDTPLGTISFVKTKNDKGDVSGAELIQSTFYVAQIKMNADGQTGLFQFIKAFEAKK